MARVELKGRHLARMLRLAAKAMVIGLVALLVVACQVVAPGPAPAENAPGTEVAIVEEVATPDVSEDEAEEVAVKGAESEAVAADATVVIEINEEGIFAPAQIPAGPTRVRFVNSGVDFHTLEVLWLADGVTMQEARNAPSPGVPGRIGAIGAIFIPAGATLETVLDFSAYPAYLVRTLFEARGASVELSPSRDLPPVMPPAADVDVELYNFAYVMPQEIPAGARWWRLHNNGDQSHEVSIYRLAEGQTLEQLQAQLEEREAGPGQRPSVANYVLEIPALSTGAGQTNHVQWDLPPGAYVIFCRVPDFSTPQWWPHHWHKGMFKEITVTG